MLLYGVRFLFAVLVLALIWAYITETGINEGMIPLWLISGGISLSAIVMLIEWVLPRKSLRALGGLFFGLMVGLVVGYALSLVVDLIALTMIPQYWPSTARPVTINAIKMLGGLISVYFCVSFVLQTKDDFRFIIPYVEFSKQAKGARPILLDTSTIIDGRIADVCSTGIFDATLIVPRFVLTELQTIADSSDRLKRNRGRRGLDILNQLQRNEKVDVEIVEPRWSRKEQAEEVVDQKLIAMAQDLDGRIITSDFNLAKVAQLRGVEVINLNDVGNALKPAVLPGETLEVKVVKPGEEQNQGVGYLPDGTMVVIEGARDRVGQDITIVVTSGLQTSAGRMLFGRVEGPGAVRGGRGRREGARSGGRSMADADDNGGPAEPTDDAKTGPE